MVFQMCGSQMCPLWHNKGLAILWY